MTVSTDRYSAFVSNLDLGTADGLAVAVKDCIDIAGHVTASGSAALADGAPAKAHAKVVEDLLASGAHVVGKAKMHELAYGMTGVNAAFGTPVNPRWPDRIPGGSSSGSAVAVAGDLCDAAVGTDTGGSVRQPAICCGLYGIKPTFGRISRDGCHPAESTLDCVGVLARSAKVLTRAMQAADPTFTPEPLTAAPRMARVRVDDLDPRIGEPLVYGLMEGLPEAGYVQLPGMEEAFDAAMTVIGAETYRACHALLDDPRLGDDVRARLSAAGAITPDRLEQAEDVRTRFTAEVDAALASVDVLITPAMPTVPPTLDEATDPAKVLPLTRFLRPFNLTGHPAIVLPVLGELPLGLQIVGRKGADAQLCAVAEWMADTCPMFRKEEFA
ncbi:amidase [Sagittula stellata]|uniref:Pyrazinamidase/nicotinamidase n=1 Tax=Sagittula stellata (strain ATCC 700073 / DSM 11524 / E-37) TaxID=388399 RepID=A3K7A5_SAGS3|nr:amidase [Sagittula stellata]EBA06864.1 pyrazinamidase/nicotinamidase [Sagittula stellata E-37]